MKILIIFLLAIFMSIGNPVSAQVGRLVNKVKNSVANELLGNPDKSSDNEKAEPEPSCACDQAEPVFDLGGKVNLMYSEISIDVLDDGSVLAKDRISGKYYVAKDGVTKGPYSEGDPEISRFVSTSASNDNNDSKAVINKDYVTKSGEKFLITFNGKTYGPYAQINSFAVTNSREKFAAIVVENLPTSQSDAKKMEEAMKNAKTDQERMDLAMQFSQQMQKNMMAGGGLQSITPKFVTNIPGAAFDPAYGGTFNAKMKFDDILVSRIDGITDLQGNKVIDIKPEHAQAEHIYVNTTNTKYVVFNYGTMSFSDGTSMSDLFNPHLMKTDGKVYLAYMYYSPKKNSIMQCKIPF